MKLALILLPLFSVALCAPVGEKAQILDVDSEDMRVKRAKEIMMFGNQQNEQQKDKSKRANSEELADKNGYIFAKEPNDLEQEELEKEPSTVVGESLDKNMAGAINSPVTYTESLENLESQTTPKNEVKTETNEPGETAAVQLFDNENEKMNVDFLKELENLQVDADNVSPYLNNIVKGRDPYWTQYLDTYNNYQRYRRNQVRALHQFPRARVLKRAHRTKRHAFYVPDMQGYLPYEEQLLEAQYKKYPVTEEELAELLDVLDGARMFDDDILVNPYEEYAPNDELENVEFESPIFVPKRQAGLTFVPGIKRNRDFYPYFIEPESHFAAFIPEKRSIRDYADAYERVMEMAAALRQQNNYPDEYIAVSILTQFLFERLDWRKGKLLCNSLQYLKLALNREKLDKNKV